MSTRISLLRSVRLREAADQIGDMTSELYQQAAFAEKACYIKLSELARASGHLQTSMNAITLAQKLVEDGDKSDDVDEEFASVLWSQGEHKAAIDLLAGICSNPKDRKAAVSARLVSLPHLPLDFAD
jgi:ataxia telangiectasia mutated family protein